MTKEVGRCYRYFGTRIKLDSGLWKMIRRKRNLDVEDILAQAKRLFASLTIYALIILQNIL